MTAAQHALGGILDNKLRGTFTFCNHAKEGTCMVYLRIVLAL